MLVRLVYASSTLDPASQQVVAAILRESNDTNLEFGITGVLCSYPDGQHFLQVLEGARDDVNQLYNNIMRDDRHGNVKLLHYGEIQTRMFASWRMGSVDLAKVNLSTLLKYSEKPKLDPFQLSGEAALALLCELLGNASVVSFPN